MKAYTFKISKKQRSERARKAAMALHAKRTPEERTAAAKHAQRGRVYASRSQVPDPS